MKNPFDGLTSLQVKKLYELLEVHIYNFDKNEEIIPTIKHENIIGIILSGKAQIMDIEYNGNEILIESLEKNSMFGSNISLTNSENYQIIAKERGQVLVIDYDKILNPKNVKYIYFSIFIRNVFDIMSTRLRNNNERIQILEKKQIREKLLQYFEMEHKKTRLRYFYLPFSLKELADYLAVNRSAMFREIKNLKEERFIEIKNKKITLLYK